MLWKELNNIKTKKWYFGNNYEEYYVLYDDNHFILVQNINTKNYSFGHKGDFGSLYGFPVNQSCLSKNECIEMLKKFIEIDKRYIDYPLNKENIKVWKKMIEIIK